MADAARGTRADERTWCYIASTSRSFAGFAVSLMAIDARHPEGWQAWMEADVLMDSGVPVSAVNRWQQHAADVRPRARRADTVPGTPGRHLHPTHAMMYRVLLFLVVAASPARLQAQTPPLPADSLERGRSWSRWFTEGHVDSLWSVVIPATGMLASRESLAGVMGEFAARAGRVTAVVEERFIWRNGQRQFRQDLTTEGLPEPLVLRWVIRPDGRLGGMGIGPASQTPPADSAGPAIPRQSR